MLPHPGGPALQQIDPSTCPHERNARLGIQRFPFPPFRVFLLRCLRCETTITTGSLRDLRRRPTTAGGEPAAAPS